MKTPLLAPLLAAVLLAAPVNAQSPANAEEIAFWETVRDSRNAAELQAYIDQYPNGRFVVLAKARLAALGQAKPAAAPARGAPATPVKAAPSTMGSNTRTPQIGDTWTYRLTYVRRFGSPTPTPSVRTHVVKIDAATGSEIVDQVLVDGQVAPNAAHSPGAYLLTQGVSVFSPYLPAFADLSRPGPLGSVAIQENACRSTHACVATARVAGTETVQVPAGTFTAVRVIVEQSWRPGPGASVVGQHQMAALNGGRTLTIWYAPEIRRAVKYTSRLTVGDYPPVDSHFDLELLSYQLK